MALLAVGDVIQIEPGHDVYADVPKHYVYGNHKGDFTLTHHNVKVGGQFDYIAGKYIVVNALMGGGGTGHGPHDVYPDGWHVYCERVSDGFKIDFYQSGSFTAMIEEIPVIGKAKIKWVFDEQ